MIYKLVHKITGEIFGHYIYKQNIIGGKNDNGEIVWGAVHSEWRRCGMDYLIDEYEIVEIA